MSRVIKAWNPDFVTTVGDNTYCIFFDASLDPYDDCVGLYYHDWMKPYIGKHGAGAADENRFWPSMGNHDWDSKLISYTTFFSLPHNERYYDFVRGPVHFFMLDSDPREPDGVTSDIGARPVVAAKAGCIHSKVEAGVYASSALHLQRGAHQQHLDAVAV